MNSGQRTLGRRTLSALREVLNERFSNSEIRDLLFKHGLEERYQGPNKSDRLSKVFHPLVSKTRYNSLPTSGGLPYEDYQGEVASTWDIIDQVAQDVSETFKGNPQSDWAEERYQTLVQALRVDGYDLLDGRVVPFLSPSVEPAAEQGVLESRLDGLGLSDARNHLDQAVDNATRGNWEAANAQLRAFMEGVCDAITERLYDGEGKPPTRGRARKHLASVGFLNGDEDELLKSFFKVLSGEGSHPGTSAGDDSHRRRLMAFSLANYYIERLQEWLARGSSGPA